MGRSKKGHRQKQQPVYGSDDERAYEKEEVPDPHSDSYYHDEIDDFHADKEKILLSKGASLEPAGFSSDEEEVLGIDSDDEDIEELDRKIRRFQTKEMEEDMASDIEDKEDDLPDDKAWGKKKNKYYGADVSDEEYVDFHGSDTDAAILEEKEALALQRKMAEELDEGDFGLDIFKSMKKTEVEKDEEVITQDLSSLSKKEKLQLLKKESPELLDLIEEYKVKMTDIRDKWLPLLRLIQNGQIPTSKGADYVQTKFRLYLNYCINISFYLMLKAKRTPVQNHPVISRLVQHRNLIKQLEVVDNRLQPEVDAILQKLKNGEEIKLAARVEKKESDVMKSRIRRLKKMVVATEKSSSQKKKLSELMDGSDSESGIEEDTVTPSGGRSHGRKKKKMEEQFETKDEKEALAYYDMMKAGHVRPNLQKEDDGNDAGIAEEMEGEADEENAEEGESGKRGITYQIAKNKGLTPHRQKIQRNPRVKHRMKYKKAKIRRRGQIREVRTEMQRYGGEMSGIRAGIIKGIKLK